MAVLILVPAVFLADERNIDFDAATDFSKIKTFAIREGKVNSQRPELNNRLFHQKLAETIRAELIAKGLTEASDHPDVSIDFTIAGQDYSVVERQSGIRVRGVVTGNGRGIVMYSEGTLVIDMKLNQAGTLVWRGTYRDSENGGPKTCAKAAGRCKEAPLGLPPKEEKVGCTR